MHYTCPGISRKCGAHDSGHITDSHCVDRAKGIVAVVLCAGSVPSRHAAARELCIVLSLASTRNAGAVGAPVAPLGIATAEEIAQLFAEAGHIRFASAAVTSNQSAGEAMRALIGEI
jgi:hypothetical protein